MVSVVVKETCAVYVHDYIIELVIQTMPRIRGSNTVVVQKVEQFPAFALCTYAELV